MSPTTILPILALNSAVADIAPPLLITRRVSRSNHGPSQRQRRLARRRKHAAGFRKAFH